MNKPLYIVIGAYGSGKSEFSIHLAQSLNKPGEQVVLADMDVVNPYFRSRDVRDEFAALGIEVIAPEGQFKHADLPMLSPRIKGAIENYGQTVVLDVGGDPAGCRTLGRFVDALSARGFAMLFVVNTFRPFTSSVEEVLQMKAQLEFASKLKITEFVCNNNLMEHTTPEIVEQGIAILDECSARTGLPFKRYLVLDSHADIVPDGLGGKQRLVMAYTLKKPWEGLALKGI
ncbi:MAG: ParA family protein [Candidatus Syntrophosphaera sp.]|nr:ParA family protein [Candidatus Syntrophosphaera sp.]